MQHSLDHPVRKGTILAVWMCEWCISTDIANLRPPRLKFEAEYFKGDKELPIYSRRVSSGYAVGDLVNILLDSNLDEHQVCSVQPLSVSENATFIIDVDTVHFQDLKADDLGV